MSGNMGPPRGGLGIRERCQHQWSVNRASRAVLLNVKWWYHELPGPVMTCVCLGNIYIKDAFRPFLLTQWDNLSQLKWFAELLWNCCKIAVCRVYVAGSGSMLYLHICTPWIFPQLLSQMLSARGNMDNIRCDLVLINCSPHLGNLLDLLDDVDGDDGDHQLDGGQGGQHRHPDDLVSLKPVQKLILTRALLHPPGGVLIILPEIQNMLHFRFLFPKRLTSCRRDCELKCG